MTTSDRGVRWGALAASLGGTTFVAEGLVYLTARGLLQDLLLALAYVLVAAGLLGFHELQRKRLGLLGRLGLYTATSGWAVALVGHAAGLEALHGLGFVLALLGYLLYGIATVRANVLPRWSGVAIAAAGPVSLFAGEYTTVVFGLFWVILGYALWGEAPRGAAARTAPAGHLTTSVLLLVVTTLGAGSLVGCGESDSDEESATGPDRLTLEATEPAKGRYAIKGARPAKSGPVEISFHNRSEKPREAQLIRIEGNHTPDEALKAIAGATEGGAVPAWLHWEGGTGETMPGKRATFTVDLGPGRYHVVDTTSGQDGKLLATQGAVAAIEAVKATRRAKLPQPAASITATEYAFKAKNLSAGRSTVALDNTGKEQHHFVLAPILKGKTFDEVKQFATSDEQTGGPPVDFENQVISGVLDGGKQQVMPLDLEAGRYALFCFVSDRAGGPPHTAKGMLAEVTVR